MARYLLTKTAWMMRADGLEQFAEAGTEIGAGTPWVLTGNPSPDMHEPLDGEAAAELARAVIEADGRGVGRGTA
jgi:hypothetical protein